MESRRIGAAFPALAKTWVPGSKCLGMLLLGGSLQLDVTSGSQV